MENKFMGFDTRGGKTILVNLSMISSVEVSSTSKDMTVIIMKNGTKYELVCSMDKFVDILNIENLVDNGGLVL